jgi:hypothetical protein
MEHSSIGNHDPCLMLAVYGVLMGWVVVVPVPKDSDAETVSMTLSFP